MNKLYSYKLRKFRNQLTERPTQIVFSEAISVTPEYYSTIETGKNDPSIALHMAICSKLDKPSDCFFKAKKHNKVFTTQQFNYLNTLDTKKLKIILGMLQAIYEENR